MDISRILDLGISVLRASHARLLNHFKKVTTKENTSYLRKLLYQVPYRVMQVLQISLHSSS